MPNRDAVLVRTPTTAAGSPRLMVDPDSPTRDTTAWRIRTHHRGCAESRIQGSEA